MDRYRRIAILAEKAMAPVPSKTLSGLLRYRGPDVVAVIDSAHAGKNTGAVLGLGHGTPVVTDFAAALRYRPDALLLGYEPASPIMRPYWREQVLLAVRAGVDIINGLHYLLSDDEQIRATAAATGAVLRDLRRPPAERRRAQFREHRSGSRTVLTVGTDCGSGKMTTLLELDRHATAAGLDSAFLATGQVGMAISGGGVAVDGLVADFVNSTVEERVFAAAAEHALVLVEGQGALNHPGYSAVTLGLLHGSRPDSMILCHDLARPALDLFPECALPSVSRAVEINEQAARWLWPAGRCRVVGVSVITRGLTDREARRALSAVEAETGLPATDPLRYGSDRLLTAVLAAPAAGSGVR